MKTTTLVDARFIERDSFEWLHAWDALKSAVGDYADECPETGERWQYMGTVWTDGRTQRVCVHQFRHRHRPAGRPRVADFSHTETDRCRVYIDLAASRRYAPQNGDSAGRVIRLASRPY